VTPPDPPPSDTADTRDDDTIIALPNWQPDVPGARPYSRAELEELLYEQTRRAVGVVADEAAKLGQQGAALDRAVASARAAGASWADIGRATNMSRQAAQQRWGR
jgi:hypothetical protein